ncbi:MAG: flagellar protein FlaG [Candidatus Accumulibacter sp.]|jgi:flagellar protein FlaG|nr:flagellar protein FlaG [Accumulibacter sp.]
MSRPGGGKPGFTSGTATPTHGGPARGGSPVPRNALSLPRQAIQRSRRGFSRFHAGQHTSPKGNIMDINGVVNRAMTGFSPQSSSPSQKSAGSASDSQAIFGTSGPGSVTTAVAASSQAVQTQSVAVENASARKEGKPEELQEATEKIQKFVSMAACNIEFSVDEGSGRTVVKVVDRETKDVIRQIPSEEMLDLAQALDKLQGLLIKQKA